MGLFSFIGDVFETIVIDPIVSIQKGITNLVGVDPIKDPLKFAATPIRAATSVAGAVVGAGAAAVGLGGAPGPGLQIVGVPIQRPLAAPVVPVPIQRVSSTGGTAAFGNFGLSQPGRGNPAWLFSGTSVRSLAGQGTSSVSSQGQWQVSGTSVRLLA